MADPYAVPAALVRALADAHGQVGLLWAQHDGPCKVLLPRDPDVDDDAPRAWAVGPTMAAALHTAVAVTLPAAVCAALGVVPEVERA